MALLVAMAVSLVSCKKASEPVLISKQSLVSINPENLKPIVLSLAASVQKGESAERTTFSNVAVNEGVWALEAAGNYLWHNNLSDKIVAAVKEYSFEVSNTVESGTTKCFPAA